MKRLTIICISFIIVSLMFAGISDAKIDPETIVGAWLFDENKGDTAKDASGNGNDGTIMGTPQWVNGKFGKALELNGVGDYVDLPQLPEQTDQPLSFTAWIKWGGSTATTRGVSLFPPLGEGLRRSSRSFSSVTPSRPKPVMSLFAVGITGFQTSPTPSTQTHGYHIN